MCWIIAEYLYTFFCYGCTKPKKCEIDDFILPMPYLESECEYDSDLINMVSDPRFLRNQIENEESVFISYCESA